ncbi:hypothetical protein [Nonomuraea aurantiaca]|jgi:pimeloyl-ACP methyl ester carboxylesterase|uniref:hypothetical protein n=1 Tax=Nonomuraea aurantiaca TaxID=2878562 RepID=UPI001CDA34EF|nr:hypothetical protein [Nonomuraea aurantiaca]MCA2219938.1 hypothetical protein [Nonomuraea aurantiaca]
MSEHHTLAPLRRVRTDVLDVACYETGPAANDTVLLLHGFPYDIHLRRENAGRERFVGRRQDTP